MSQRDIDRVAEGFDAMFASMIVKQMRESMYTGSMFGHDAGDIVLKTFADVLKKNTRASDICGRLGGDEFLLVLTHVEGDNIALAVNRFREQFAALSFPLQGQSVKVTASFGVTGFQNNEVEEFATLVRRADQMLYEAKRAGRNLVRASSPE